MSETKEFTSYEKMPLGYAIQKLGEAVTSPFREQVIARAQQSIADVQEFLGNAIPTPNLTEEEAEWSSSIHAYMRKYMDSPLSVILYRMIAEDRVKRAWYSFIKNLLIFLKEEKGDRRYQIANIIVEIFRQHRYSWTTDEEIFIAALKMWDKDEFKTMVEQIKEWKVNGDN